MALRRRKSSNQSIIEGKYALCSYRQEHQEVQKRCWKLCTCATDREEAEIWRTTKVADGAWKAGASKCLPKGRHDCKKGHDTDGGECLSKDGPTMPSRRRKYAFRSCNEDAKIGAGTYKEAFYLG